MEEEVKNNNENIINDVVKEKNLIKQEKKVSKKRVYFLDILRIIAAIAVVFIHVSGCDEFYTIGVNTYEWNMSNIFNSIARFAIPVFVMISGYLFLDPKKEVTIKKLYTKNILKIAIIYVFWSTVYMTIDMKTQLMHPNMQIIKEFIKKIIGGKYHMWYLFTILELYMIVPFLRKIVEDKKLTKYFLGLSFIFSIVIPTFKSINFIPKVVPSFIVNLISGFMFLFVLGYYLKDIKFKKWQRYSIYVLGIIGTICTIVGTKVLSVNAGQLVTTLQECLKLNIILEGVAVFVLIKTLFENKQIGEKTGKVITILSSLTLGIYVVHIMFLEFFRRHGLLIYKYNTGIAIPALSILVLICSSLFVYILKKIPVVKKYLV